MAVAVLVECKLEDRSTSKQRSQNSAVLGTVMARKTANLGKQHRVKIERERDKAGIGAQFGSQRFGRVTIQVQVRLVKRLREKEKVS